MSIQQFFRVIFRQGHRRTDYVVRRVNRACEMQEKASAGLEEAIAVLLARDSRKVITLHGRKRYKAGRSAL